ncbi:unnamed protein product [Didymodactylos carnosus]|uniref:Uncharacterized protein n=1 Tax=Didymodactylos carnosus TaxID=1234261 RepID=A0A815IL72_9BILA|nr:unnamed protein product [Didymodactylos carnosus]CAF1367335.1 unnamed protein product [Didymodactylos carnosus]CAF3554889.1 unnamed protein product [Didymodactylos carnosus]CAF4250432.1 unnamed protein product [Didymodactylos carnosus]
MAWGGTNMQLTSGSNAAVERNGNRNKRWYFMIASLCCVGLIGLLTASTIVLALIPIYLNKHGGSTGSKTSSTVIVYSAQATADTLFTGELPASNNKNVTRQVMSGKTDSV